MNFFFQNLKPKSENFKVLSERNQLIDPTVFFF